MTLSVVDVLKSVDRGWTSVSPRWCRVCASFLRAYAASVLQLETVFVLEGLGPSAEDGEQQPHPSAASFEDQARLSPHLHRIWTGRGRHETAVLFKIHRYR